MEKKSYIKELFEDDKKIDEFKIKLYETLYGILKDNIGKEITGAFIRREMFERNGFKISFSPVWLRKTIQKFRNKKIMITATNKGYRLWDLNNINEQDIQVISKYIDDRRKEMRQEAITINCLVNALKTLENAK